MRRIRNSSNRLASSQSKEIKRIRANAFQDDAYEFKLVRLLQGLRTEALPVPSIARYPALIEILRNAPKVNHKDLIQVICFRRYRGYWGREILHCVQSRHRSADAALLPQ